jgi:hypothetical protein
VLLAAGFEPTPCPFTETFSDRFALLVHNTWLLYPPQNPIFLVLGLSTLSIERPGDGGEGGLAGIVLEHAESKVAELNVLCAHAIIVVAGVNRGDILAIVWKYRIARE